LHVFLRRLVERIDYFKKPSRLMLTRFGQTRDAQALSNYLGFPPGVEDAEYQNRYQTPVTPAWREAPLASLPWINVYRTALDLAPIAPTTLTGTGLPPGSGLATPLDSEDRQAP